MSAATVHDLVALLNHGLEDTTRTDEILAEVQDNLGRSKQWLTSAAVSTVAGTATYTFTAPTTLEILHVFVDGYDVPLTKAEDLELDPNWRDAVGIPQAYTINQEADLVLRLWPTPDGVYTLFPVVATRRTAWQTWLNAWLALEVTTKEFQREGAEQDPAYAQAVAQVSALLAQGVLKIDHPERPRAAGPR